MSVVTKNPFALLDDEDGPAPAAPPSKQAAAAAPAAAAADKKAGDKKAGPASRGGRYYQRGGGNQGSRSENVNEDATDAPKKFDGEKARRGGTRGRGEGGRGEGRGRGRGRGGPRGGDRQDRHSATGIVDSDKKVHQGWGGDTGSGEQLVEAQGAADAQNDWAGVPTDTTGWGAPAAETSNDWGAPAAAADANDWAAGGAETSGDAAAPAAENGAAQDTGRNRRRREEDEEDEKLQTLEQFRATQTTGLEELVPKLEVRQANEGKEGDELFKGAKKLVKDEDESNYFVGKGKNTPRARTQKEAKQTIEIDGRFDRPSRGGDRGRGDFRGGRGRGEGRGRGRGEGRGGEGRGRGGGRPAASTNGRPQQAYNPDDASAFPSLS